MYGIVLDLAEVPRAIANRDIRGAVKLVIHADTGRVVGIEMRSPMQPERRLLAATYALKAGPTFDHPDVGAVPDDVGDPSSRCGPVPRRHAHLVLRLTNRPDHETDPAAAAGTVERSSAA